MTSAVRGIRKQRSREIKLQTTERKATPERRGSGETWAPWIERSKKNKVEVYLRPSFVTKETATTVFMQAPPSTRLAPCSKAEFDRVESKARDPKGCGRRRCSEGRRGEGG